MPISLVHPVQTASHSVFTTLQAGRFFAAMAVVGYHALLSITAFVDVPSAFATTVLKFGYLGVDFFFVLSGFVIHYSMSSAPRRISSFVYSRYTRIMLPYWPVGIGLGLAYLTMPHLAPQFTTSDSAWGWLSTITLFPTGQPPTLNVAWTLQHELLFYSLYATLRFFDRVAAGLILWTTAIILFFVLDRPEMIFFQVLLAPINIEFVAGVLAAHVFMRGPRMKGIACFGVAFTLILSFVLMGSNRHDSLLIGLAMATLLPWLCHQEMQGRFTVPNWLIFGGAASYAIYLVHNPLFSLSSRLMGAVGLDWMSALVLSFCTATGAGFAYYLAWERTIMQWAGKKVSKPKSLGKT